LPGLNGPQLADQAREHRPDLKVLFITGYAENAAVASGLLEQGMEMITKPFAVEALAIRIREMIEQQGRRSVSMCHGRASDRRGPEPVHSSDGAPDQPPSSMRLTFEASSA
jgi:DNA-binding response OmpR family regulator